MNEKELIECINFFNKLIVTIDDVTTEQEKEDGYKIVIASYKFEDQFYTTKRLHYKNVKTQHAIHNPDVLEDYFGSPVYWLDIDEHDWPHGKGAEIEHTVIDEMVEGDNRAFKTFLKSIANNQKTGYLQRITMDGRGQMYGFNLTNNNHWHDIIFLLQKAISNKGIIPKEYFSPLIFNWVGTNPNKKRQSMDPHFGNRKIIWELQQNIKKMENTLLITNTVKTLEAKKQIILQGPPGTGKTRLAKQIAKQIIGETSVDIPFIEIKKALNVGSKIPNASGVNNYYTIKEVKDNSVVLVSDRTTQDWEPTYKQIISKYNQLKQGIKPENSNGLHPYELAVALFLLNNTAIPFQETKPYQLIQFHPSYTYEDFVRGITVQNNDRGQIEYRTEDKILAKTATTAYKNYTDSKKESSIVSEENWLLEQFEEFKDFIIDAISENPEGKFELNETCNIIAVEDNAFRYTGNAWKNEFRMKYADLLALFSGGIIERRDIKHQNEINSLARTHATYYKLMLDHFGAFMVGKKAPLNDQEKIQEKKYVLIIDEINRANLSSVLGELIYALEYRGEPVESMYAIDEKNSIVLPPNLYIIGTMNTADRSVGQIDYAIRRRFSFIDILPKILENDTLNKGRKETDPELKFAKDSFIKVSSLFVKNENLDDKLLIPSDHLSEEFKPKDVWLGHSYFILEKDGDFRENINYEIKPILEEYIKDGILKESAQMVIDKL